jgi:hypothetical protein
MRNWHAGVIVMSRRLLSLILSIVLCSGVIAGVLLPAGPAAAAKPDWFLAEGSTAWGFDAQISIQNPNNQVVNAQVTYLGQTGVITTITYFLYATSQTNINVKNAIGEKDFSAKVHCIEGLTIAVDRTMYWMGGPGSDADKEMELHSSVGVEAASPTWFLPEGSSAWGFETWLLIQNPNNVGTTCHITYMIEGAAPQYFDKVVPANSRRTFNMADDIGSHDASIRVESPPPQPVIVERSVYRNSRRLGTDSTGATAAANAFLLGEGTTAWGFTTYLLIQNPTGAPVDVAVWFLTPGGPVPYPGITMPALSRRTIRVNDYLPNTDCSFYVQGLAGANIVAERSMYWGGDTPFGEAAHDSIGVDNPHYKWYLPDGGCGQLTETWTLVQNPNNVPVNILITYMSEAGTTTLAIDTLQPYTRKTYDMAHFVPQLGNYATKVESTTPNFGIIVERSMYYDTQALGKTFRTGGSNTIGAWED